ncbi:GrpB family protein [Devosia sp.]|uniref:GrpB family protein n=1 Tax=Devosia sp. TaxID=1871048 RepID=UPI0029311434|nr:GrpB family protein [Devosia sp.]
MSDAIALVAPDPGWPAAYAWARDEILSLLPAPPLLIEHIGSTAVPGLMSKPVIDIIVLIADMAPVQDAIPLLERIGYELRPDVSSPVRLFLRRIGADGVRTHHLHIHTDRDDVRRHLLFRDQLRADAATRRDYEALKQDLARRHAGDREAYAKGKDAFIDAVVQAAGGPERRPFWKA